VGWLVIFAVATRIAARARCSGHVGASGLSRVVVTIGAARLAPTMLLDRYHVRRTEPTIAAFPRQPGGEAVLLRQG
jgi:hypothetical protein